MEYQQALVITPHTPPHPFFKGHRRWSIFGALLLLLSIGFSAIASLSHEIETRESALERVLEGLKTLSPAHQAKALALSEEMRSILKHLKEIQNHIEAAQDTAHDVWVEKFEIQTLRFDRSLIQFDLIQAEDDLALHEEKKRELLRLARVDQEKIELDYIESEITLAVEQTQVLAEELSGLDVLIAERELTFAARHEI